MYLNFNNKDINNLISKDKILGDYIKNKGTIKRERENDFYYSLVRSIVGQQISTKAQHTIMKRIKDKLKNITPDEFIKLSEEEIIKFGLTGKKAEYLQNLTNNIVNKKLDLNNLKKLSDEEIITELTKIKGIGRWSAEMFLIFALNRINVISYEDLGIKRGIKKLYNKEEVTKDFFNSLKKIYDPYNSIASLYLWEAGREKEIGFFKTSIGYIQIKYDNNTLYELTVLREKPKYINKNILFLKEVELEVNNYLSGKSTTFNIKYKLEGTPFQLKVWKALTKIPYGKTKSYKDIAISIKSPKAYRAVGNANNKNPIAIIVPCHRVIGSNKDLVGYGLGLDLKEKLLELEQNKMI